jgi:hypothetical protein
MKVRVMVILLIWSSRITMKAMPSQGVRLPPERETAENVGFLFGGHVDGRG